MYTAGAPITLTATFTDPFTDPSGAAADPDAVSVTVTDPAGAVLPALVAVRDRPGAYHADFTPTVAGRYQWFFVGTGVNASVQAPDVLNVAPAATGALVSLSAVKRELNKTGTADDDQLLDKIAAATDIVNGRYGRHTTPVVITETVTPGVEHDPGSWAYLGVIVLSHLPVLAVTSIVAARTDGPVPDLTRLLPGGLDSGVLRFPGWVPDGYPLTVTYTAGATSVPASLQEACLLITTWLWETQRGGQVAVPGSTGDDSIDPTSAGMPTRALELIDETPFARLPGFA